VGSGLQQLHRSDEPVTAFRQSFDVVGVLRRVAQGLPDLVDCRAQTVVEVDYRFRSPDLLLQFLPGDDFSGVAEQDGEQPERLALEFDAYSTLSQLTGAKVGFEDAKTDLPHPGRALLEHRTSTAYHTAEPELWGAITRRGSVGHTFRSSQIDVG
jgi:hypothetical protein